MIILPTLRAGADLKRLGSIESASLAAACTRCVAAKVRSTQGNTIPDCDVVEHGGVHGSGVVGIEKGHSSANSNKKEPQPHHHQNKNVKFYIHTLLQPE